MKGLGTTFQHLVKFVLGNLQIGFTLAATNDLYYGGCRFRAGTGILVLVGLRKQLEKLGFNLFSFVLVHQFFFLVFVFG